MPPPFTNPPFTPTGVHLVGSIPLSSAREVFTKTSTTLPHRLLRIPDGETTSGRQNFVLFQTSVFSTSLPDVPQILRQYDASLNSIPPTSLPTASELSALATRLSAADLEGQQPFFQTRYDSHALECYENFQSLRSSGVIPPGTKFQVSLPTPLNVLCLIADGYQGTIEPFYEAALTAAVRNLSASIPHRDLAIQWDAAAEFAMLEGAHWPHFKPFFASDAVGVKEGIIERLVRLADMVDVEVEVGFHLCYGDMGHQHFAQPKDMIHLVEVANAIIQGSKRVINWLHMPVPKERTDEEYFAPLKGLHLEKGKTELFLGLVHYDNLEGSRERIESAASVIGGKGKMVFGVATECGMGRTPGGQLDSILEISREVSAAYERMTG